MKWQLTEPKYGDIIRVAVGKIYHYGIYVSDEEVIQFGLSPALRNNLSDKDVEVCVSNIDDFLLGGFLEVGSIQSKHKKRNSPKQTVLLARSKVGEKGYNIIHNNCEHFAYECLGLGKVSYQTEGVRKLFAKLNYTDVYIAKIPKVGWIKKVYPSQRNEEIQSVSNKRLKKEKYYVWKLLEYALKNSLNLNISEVQFSKSEAGFWYSNKCKFSLTHSDGVVGVALSSDLVGIDVEEIKDPVFDISNKILSSREKEEYSKLKDNKPTYLINVWTKKESLFKVQNIKSLSLEEFVNLDGKVYQENFIVNNRTYSLSVATNNFDKVKIYRNIKL